MRVRLSTELPIPADVACRLARKPAMFRHVVWPIFGVRDLPRMVAQGEEVSARLYWLLLLPAWRHHLTLVSIGETELYSNEHGGPVRKWNHRLTFEPTSSTTCTYTDEVQIDAGPATLLVVLFAQLIYRWRQRRWRRIAEILA